MDTDVHAPVRTPAVGRLQRERTRLVFHHVVPRRLTLFEVY